jgi:diguanylate cyclase (GGDEF)-like protein/PAS domain S-box-containing protein
MATILVVEDRPINREFLAALLSYAGHRVQEAADGAEALALMRTAMPDLVISDILMPIMDGVEFARRIGADPALGHIPIIFYTATYRIAEARKLADSCGVSTVIAKPSEPQVILDTVHGELGMPLIRFVPHSADPQPVPPSQALCSSYLEELSDLQLELKNGTALAPPLNGEAKTNKRIFADLDRSFLRAQALSMRLAALLELSLDLARQDNAAQMLELFCHAARDIMNARFAGVCVLDETGAVEEFSVWGIGDAQAAAVRADLNPRAGLLGEVLCDGAPRRCGGLAGATVVGLPASHPRIDNFLAVPVKTATRAYGWFYAADRLGSDEFPEGDEQLALTLASQLAPEYENRILYDRISHHASALEIEINERKDVAERMLDSELKFRQLAENIREVFLLIDIANAKMLYVSPTYEEVWERSCESLYAQPWSWLDAIHPEDIAKTMESLNRSREQDSGHFDIEFRIVRPDGGLRWIRSRSFPIRDDAGTVYRLAGIAEDITEHKVQELSIRRLSRIHAVLSGINSAIVRVHDRQKLLDEACRIAVEEGGFPIAWIALIDPTNGNLRPAASRGIDEHTFSELCGYLTQGSVKNWGPARRALTSKQPVVLNDIRQNLDPNTGPVSRFAVKEGYGSVISLPILPNDELAGVIVLYAEETDFFDQQEIELLRELAGDVSFALQYITKEEQLNYLAYYDSLTGLPNTTLFHERLSQIVQRRPRTTAAVFLVDLDRFTQLNDSFGRHVGDGILSEVAQRLRATVPEPNHLARISSDTFVVAVSALRNATEAGMILQEKVFAALNRPFLVGGNELRISARAGIAIHPADGNDAATLFKNAEAALRQAKASGARFMFYSPELNSRVAEDLALEQRLLAALERQEFLVHYQPKVAAKSGELVGLEALVRWNSPETGLVQPDRFIRALEDTELILDVGRWVLEKALLDYRSWQQQGLRVPRIAVNVSPIQLRYADFPEMVLTTIERSGVTGTAIELEITESVIMADIESNTDRLQQICDQGVTIAIDDFGTGYSSLRYLAKLPVHTLKIDRSFVVSMATDADSMTLVSTIIGLAHSFDLTVVAEGVDAEDQAQLLRLMKCDVLQGYLFGKPLPAEQIAKLLPPDDH